MKDNQFTIIEQREIAKEIFSLTLLGDIGEYEPGQFVQVEVSDTLEPFLRRPISICDIDNDKMRLVYRKKGRGTFLLSQKQVGARLKVLGPLGHGFPQKGPKATLIGGGIGVPPLLGLAKSMYLKGIKIKTLLGFNNKESAILLDEFAVVSDLSIATIDGSLGHKGLVTDLIDDRDSLFYACGPEALFKSLEREKLEGYYSLEKRMACGVGVCLGCNITVNNGDKDVRKRVCYDGPVFPIGSVRWEK